MSVKVIKPGLLTTVQDLGRPGYFHLGIPIGGAMDRLALRAGNMLVGNDEGAAALEAVFMGPELAFDSDALVAVTGADMPAFVDGQERPGWTSFEVKAGQTLSFGFLKSGARVYIAISGGIDTPPALGSRSTYAIGALGGVDGRAIAAGDSSATGSKAAQARRVRRSRQTCAVGRVRLPNCGFCRGFTGTGSPRRRKSTSLPTNGPWRRRPTVWDTVSATDVPWNSLTGNNPLARVRTRPTSLTVAILTARFRCPAGQSRSSCTATRFQAAGTS